MKLNLKQIFTSESTQIPAILTTIVILLISGGVGVSAITKSLENEKWKRICDGVSITEICQDEEGIRYSKYIFHEAKEEVTDTIDHEAVPAKTHNVYHEAVYGTREVIDDCIRTNISYKQGTCALSQCRDGTYSGSTGRGTCSYHGGVMRTGGPWYTYRIETYMISPAWTETVIDVPAKEAWTETIIVSPAKEAWIEKEIVK